MVRRCVRMYPSSRIEAAEARTVRSSRSFQSTQSQDEERYRRPLTAEAENRGNGGVRGETRISVCSFVIRRQACGMIRAGAHTLSPQSGDSFPRQTRALLVFGRVSALLMRCLHSTMLLENPRYWRATPPKTRKGLMSMNDRPATLSIPPHLMEPGLYSLWVVPSETNVAYTVLMRNFRIVEPPRIV